MSCCRQLLNNGPSTFSKAELQVDWPYQFSNGSLLYITSYETEGPINCTTDLEINPLKVTVRNRSWWSTGPLAVLQHVSAGSLGWEEKQLQVQLNFRPYQHTSWLRNVDVVLPQCWFWSGVQNSKKTESDRQTDSLWLTLFLSMFVSVCLWTDSIVPTSVLRRTSVLITGRRNTRVLFWTGPSVLMTCHLLGCGENTRGSSAEVSLTWLWYRVLAVLQASQLFTEHPGFLNVGTF